MWWNSGFLRITLNVKQNHYTILKIYQYKYFLSYIDSVKPQVFFTEEISLKDKLIKTGG